jgi:hypothetical protein
MRGLASAVCALALSSLACAAPGGDVVTSTTSSESGDGDGDGDGDASGDGDGEPVCGPVPEECQRFLACLEAILPSSVERAEAMFGVGGSCWCDTTPVAVDDCVETCLDQLDTAVAQYPTEPACHESSCTLGQLDPAQPYGPVVDGQCPDYAGVAQLPLENPAELEGTTCAPPCNGLLGWCPDHTQSSAQGTCYLTVDGADYCVNRCYVDPTHVGGTQCQCGAICQPDGSVDSEGIMRGVCLFP